MPYSRLANPSATKAVLESFGLVQRKRLGQHFLVDDHVVGKILELANVSRDDVVLEVGPGIGTLTVALCERARAIVAVERDERLVEALSQAVEGCAETTIVAEDAVRVRVERLVSNHGPPTTFVSNLPYEVAATLVLRYLEEIPSLRSATVMVQSEVADRMTAGPGTKEYGAYTVKLALRASVAGRFKVSRNSFMPPPRVDSAVVRLERRELANGPDLLELAATAADASFAQRRKKLRNSIASALAADPGTVADALVEAGVSPDLRAEALEPETFVEIGRELGEKGILP
jgi:16S rRNA (adenine1518-N6/adenine1519-N6)-dimethyltransferase